MGTSAALSPGVLSAAIASASPGAVLEAQLFPVVGTVGRLRITYNWLYSALNCDPNDASTFAWIVNKLANGQVSLSPSDGYAGMTLYASVRPDLSDFVQVQAPYSADWITAVGGDESLTMNDLGFLTINLTGLNGQYVAVNQSATSHDNHAGYLVQSNASAAGPWTNLFVAVTQTLQSGLAVPMGSELSQETISAALAAQGVSGDVSDLVAQIAGVAA